MQCQKPKIKILSLRCFICKIKLCNQSSFNRHLYSDIHRHNLLDPYYTLIRLCQSIPIDLLNLIWDYTYIKAGTVFDFLEDGYMWKAYDIIFRRKMLDIGYQKISLITNPKRKVDNITCVRQIAVIENPNYVYKEILFHTYFYHMEVPEIDIDYVWGKIKGIKNKAVKSLNFNTQCINEHSIEVLQ